MQDQILEMLLKKDDLSWQSILYDLIKSEKMDPWDIDISVLSQKYLELVKQMKNMDFFISGKVVLASAILLKMKSNKLVEENIASFDSNLFQQEQIPEEYFEDLSTQERLTNPKLTIRTPQSRKKKVSIIDLVKALEKALEVEKRRNIRHTEYDYIPEMKMPEKKVDISKRIKDVYSSILNFFNKNNVKTVKFSSITPSSSKQDIIATFIPILHLDNQKKIDIHQEAHFQDFNINLREVKNEGD